MTWKLSIALVFLVVCACSFPGRDPAPIAAETPRPAPTATRAPPAPAIAREPLRDAPAPGQDEAIDRVLAAQRALDTHGVTVGDPPDVFQIPPAARPHLAELDRAWAAYLTAALPALIASPSDADLSKALTAPLERRGVAHGYEAQEFGALLGLHAKSHPGALLGVVVSVSTACGHDATLFLFSTKGDEVRHLLTAAARKREALSDGQLGLGYAIVPGAPGRDPEVVVASITPWCSSAWRTLRYDVLSPGSDPSRPKRKLHREDSIWIGDGKLELEADANGFRIRYDSWAKKSDAVVEEKTVVGRRAGDRWIARGS